MQQELQREDRSRKGGTLPITSTTFLKDIIQITPSQSRDPLKSKEIQPVHPKGNSPEYSLEGLMLKLKLQYFGHLMQRTDSQKRP